MRFVKKIYLLALIFSLIPASTIAQVQAKTALVPNEAPAIEESEALKRAASPEHKKDREAFAFLIAEYSRRTSPWAPSADDLLRLPSRSIVDGYPSGFRIWPGNDPRNDEAWGDLLKSQGIAAENIALKKAAPVKNVIVFISDKELYGFSVDPVRISSSPNPMIRIVFERGFYCQAFVNSRDMPLTPNECFLDHWQGRGVKSARDEAELAYRLILMSGELYKWNRLRDNSVLQEIDGCFNGPNVRKFHEVREKISRLNRDRQSDQVDERTYSEKLTALEKEGYEISSSGEARSCAEFIFRYEYGAANAMYDTSQRLTVCLKPGQDCKKRGELTKISPPKTMVQFLVYGGSKKSALENYVRLMLPVWYPGGASLYGPVWNKYKTPH